MQEVRWCKMKPKEAFEILRDTPIDIRSAREDDIHSLYATAQNMALDALQRKVWIPCSERLPECEWGAETEALMYQVGDTIYTGHFGRGGLWRDEYFRRYADIKEGVDASDVIAWMPLPEPYKEGESDGH